MLTKENIIEKLKVWRNEDHEDSIVLKRNQIINILEEYKNLEDSRQELYRLVMG